MTTLIYSWNRFSSGAKGLAQSLGIKRIRHRRDGFRGSPDITVINWGATELPFNAAKCERIVNWPGIIQNNTNKILFFRNVQDYCRIPHWTTDKETAKQWMDEGRYVCVRTLVSSSGGKGLHVIGPGEPVPQARLYTQYVPKMAEYRVHFAFGEQIDIQKKILPPHNKKENTNFKIRNLENGFIYSHNTGNIPADVIQQATAAYRKTGLDFGAVDVIYNRKEDQAYILEINTAPGIQDITLEKYTEAFRKGLGI